MALLTVVPAPGQETDSPAGSGNPEAAEAPEPRPYYIRHYRIKGASKLPRVDIEGAVYPFMGPACTDEHALRAAAALQKVYHDAGYKTVTVQVPLQEVKYGVITLEVSEGKIGRLRVRGSRYFSPEDIKRRAPSLAEGEVPDFDNVTKEIIALNSADREVTPKLLGEAEGAAPGTFDVDLVVKDKLPLHGSLELNNRYSPDTTELRLNGGLSYSNLWQAEHTAGFNFQLAPERLEDATVYSAYYMLPIGEDTSLMLTGTKQDSDLNTLGGAGVAGRGYVLGARVNWTLPQVSSWQPESGPLSERVWTPERFFHTLSLGVDFKHFDEDVTVGAVTRSTPIEYFPVSLTYTGTWVSDPEEGPEYTTELTATTTFHTRGLGSDVREFDSKRYKATGSFFHLRGDLSHTHELPGGFEVFTKIQGQWSDVPLINSEQYSGGGLGNSRGYLESTVLGDSAFFGTLELRSPSLIGRRKPWAQRRSLVKSPSGEEPDLPPDSEWRFHLFCDAGVLTTNDPLPEQDSNFYLLSVGAGSRFDFRNLFHGSVDAGFPLRDAGPVSSGDVLVTFRLWTDF